jgi:hypothetical protein
MVFLRIILGFILSKEGNVMDPKKVEDLVMPIPITLRRSKFSMGWHNS